MTDPDREHSRPTGDAPAPPDDPLDSFKAGGGGADNPNVSDAGVPTRADEDSVPDEGDADASGVAPPKSSFQFDLGGALARIAGPDDAPSDPRAASAVESAAVGPPVVDPRVAGPGADAPAPLPEREPPSPAVAPAPAPPSAAGPVAEAPSPEVRQAHPTPNPRPAESSEPEPEPEPLPVRRPKAPPATAPASPPAPVAAPVEPAPEPLPVRQPRTTAAAPSQVPPSQVPPSTGPEAPAPAAGHYTDPRTDPHAGHAAAPTPTPEPAAEPEPSTRSRLRRSRAVPVADLAPQPPPPRSVFDDAAPAPHLPSSPSWAPTQRQQQAPLPPGAVPGLPTLPASVPSAPPPMVAPIASAPATPDINALRSAQMRAKQNQRRGKFLGRSILAILVLGALIAGALVFGRTYLFPTEWDARLTPIVDDIQLANGIEFDEAVALIEQPVADYGTRVTEWVLGPGWDERLPEWRALGIAGGEGARSEVESRFAAMYPAFYDPAADAIFLSDSATGDAIDPALRLAVESAFATHLGDGPPERTALGLTGVDSLDDIARRAVDAQLVGLSGAAPLATEDLAGLPLPVVYELRAIEAFGASLLAGSEGAAVGDPLPDSIALLADAPNQALGGVRRPSDQQLADPVALGSDDWAVIWGARLPPASASALARVLTADSYTPVSRGGLTCFVAVFQTSNELSATSLASSLSSWAALAPANSQASVTSVGANRVQLEACDPGAELSVLPAPDSVDAMIANQLARLAG